MHEIAPTGVHAKHDDIIVVALARGRTRQQAADEAGVCLRTVGNRLADPEFRQRVAEARRELLQTASARLCDAIGDCIDKLRSLLNSESESIQLGSARALLQSLWPLREIEDLAARIEALENRP